MNLVARKKKLYPFVALLWTIAVVVACLLPGSSLPESNIPKLDKLVHILMFGGITFFWLKSLSTPSYGKTAIIVLGCMLLGLAIELLQASGLTSERSFEWADLAADTFGSLLAALVFWWRYGRPHARQPLLS